MMHQRNASNAGRLIGVDGSVGKICIGRGRIGRGSVGRESIGRGSIEPGRRSSIHERGGVYADPPAAGGFVHVGADEGGPAVAWFGASVSGQGSLLMLARDLTCCRDEQQQGEDEESCSFRMHLFPIEPRSSRQDALLALPGPGPCFQYLTLSCPTAERPGAYAPEPWYL